MDFNLTLSQSTIKSLLEYVNVRQKAVGEDCSLNDAIAEAAELGKLSLLQGMAQRKVSQSKRCLRPTRDN